jgi:hypothetical protein
VVPGGLEEHSGVVSESFPAAMRIGGELLAQGNVLGAELIENARWAFVEGMTDAAVAPAIVALVTAYLVKRYMPSGLKKEVGGSSVPPIESVGENLS